MIRRPSVSTRTDTSFPTRRSSDLILRNLSYAELRKRRREVEDTDGGYAATLCSQPNQIAALELKDFRRALAQLPPEQREALVLIGASGFSYEDAAPISGCAIGTMKSRVHRGTNRLAALRQITPSQDLPGGKAQNRNQIGNTGGGEKGG